MPSQRSQATRERILDAANAAFRERGFAATGVDTVMARAGLTHGGFYAHFRSKNDLLQAAIAHASAQPSRYALFAAVAHLRGPELLATMIERYLSLWHCDHPEAGCPVPTLGAELPRLDPDLGAAIGDPVRRLGAFIRDNLPPPAESAAARAQALLALLVGGVVTARTLPAAERDAWLAGCRAAARQLAGLPPQTPGIP